MKKLTAIVTTTALVAGMALSACGGSGSSSTTAAATTAAETTAAAETTTAAETTAAAGSEAAETTAAGGASDVTGPVTSDFYDGKNITLYCGYSAGGSSDTLCRLFAGQLSKVMGNTTVNVENVSGAAGWVLWNQMLENTEPDGYNFCLINTPNIACGKLDQDNPMKYDYNDFYLICNEVTDPAIIAIRADDDRFSDWDSFINYWKQEGTLMTSSSGLGIVSDDATCANLVAQDQGVTADIVVSKGAGDNVTFLLNKTTDFLTGNASEVVQGQMDGQFKVLCVFADERYPSLPDTPTYEELTGKKITYGSSRGWAMLKDSPDEAKEVLSNAIKTTVQSPEMIKQLSDIYTNTNYVAGDDYKKFLDASVETAKKAYGME